MPPRISGGLDWLNFFVANVQTGFGPFIAVYLTAHAWTQERIGFALSVGAITGIIAQVPGGALVDAMASKRLAALAATVAIAACSLLLAFFPDTLPVLLAEVFHGFASCMLTPALSAISLALVGRAALGERLGRNARFGSIGNGAAAAALGACGTYVSEQSVFILTALLTLPALVCLVLIGSARGRQAPLPLPARRRVEQHAELWRLVTGRPMLVFLTGSVLFNLSNAALLPIAAGEATRTSGSTANLLIAAAIVAPQLVVALASPAVGRGATTYGRRPLLILGFAALPVRALLLAVIHNSYAFVAIQALDGISGASLGVLLPLIAADVSRGTARFNTCLGVIGLAVGLGATISTSLAGFIADRAGTSIAFATLAGFGLAAVAVIALAMPETRPDPASGDPAPRDPGAPGAPA